MRIAVILLCVGLSACTAYGPRPRTTPTTPTISATITERDQWSGIPSLYGNGRFIGSSVRIGENQLLTAKHVIEGRDDLQLFDGTPVEVVYVHPVADLALLYAADLAGPVYMLATAVRGEPVVAKGYIGYGATPIATHGHVSAVLPRKAIYDGGIHPGMSGGPLLNSADEVVGICAHAIAWANAHPESVNPIMGFFTDPSLIFDSEQ